MYLKTCHGNVIHYIDLSQKLIMPHKYFMLLLKLIPLGKCHFSYNFHSKLVSFLLVSYNAIAFLDKYAIVKYKKPYNLLH